MMTAQTVLDRGAMSWRFMTFWGLACEDPCAATRRRRPILGNPTARLAPGALQHHRLSQSPMSR